MYKLVNVMETLVLETLDEVLRTRKDVCSCERCRMDLAAITLNKLPASYVVTEEGEVIQRTKSLRQQFKVDVFKAIAEAIEIVSKHPHHHREGAGNSDSGKSM